LFFHELDYGSDPGATFNGHYENLLTYTVNAIAVFDGRTVWVPRGAMLVDGHVYISQRMTQWGLPTRVPVQCEVGGTPLGGTHYRDTRRGPRSGAVVSTGSVSVSRSGLSFDPGEKVRWNIDCGATETLETHGLIGGPQFVLPAPAKSRFAATAPFSIGCKKQFSHGFEPGDVNGHSFKGEVRVFVAFTPFPASKLDATRKALSAKTALENGYGFFRSKTLKNCL
jgi:hypothetical protein